MEKNLTKSISYMGLGIALYVVFAMCLRVPVFENYYLCLGYIVMAVYCYSFGPLHGTVVGTLGCVLYCILINGFRGMPGWTLGNLFIGIIVGITFSKTKKMKNTILKYIVDSIVIVIACAIAMIIIKSGVESILYLEPMFLRIAKNIYAFVSDVFVLIISIPICVNVDKILRKNFNIQKI